MLVGNFKLGRFLIDGSFCFEFRCLFKLDYDQFMHYNDYVILNVIMREEFMSILIVHLIMFCRSAI